MMDDWEGLPPGEPIKGKTYRADGWVYRDMPAFATDKVWDEFLDILGEDNYRILGMSVTSGNKHGQFLISPKGVKNMSTFIRDNVS